MLFLCTPVILPATYDITPQEVHPGVCAECVGCEFHTSRGEAGGETACLARATVPQQ